MEIVPPACCIRSNLRCPNLEILCLKNVHSVNSNGGENRGKIQKYNIRIILYSSYTNL